MSLRQPVVVGGSGGQTRSTQQLGEEEQRMVKQTQLDHCLELKEFGENSVCDVMANLLSYVVIEPKHW